MTMIERGETAPSATVTTGMIDIHHHFLPPAYKDATRAWTLGNMPEMKFVLDWDIQQAIDDMDRLGIAAAIGSISTPGLWFGDKAQTRSDARACNEYAAQIVRDLPKRLGFFAVLPLPDVDGTLKEIAYAFDVLKADGVSMMTSYKDRWQCDPEFVPVFEELNRRKAVVFTHPAVPDACLRMAPGVQAGTLEFLFDTARAITSLLYAGTFSSNPDIRFIFNHCGGAMPPLVRRVIRTLDRDPAKVARNPNGGMYELRKLYYDIATAANPITLGGLVKLAPLDHLLFGTDFPFVPMDVTVEDMAKSSFSDSEKGDILRGNALALFPRFK